MIVDRLQNAERIFGIHPGFRNAFEFLRRSDLSQLPDGRHEIADERLFAVIARDQGRGREKSLLEFHRKYIDIQYVINGADSIGWLPTAKCERIATPYDPDKDLGFYYDRPHTWLELFAGYFAVLYPDDAHAPLATEAPVHKAVVKVMVDYAIRGQV